MHWQEFVFQKGNCISRGNHWGLKKKGGFLEGFYSEKLFLDLKREYLGNFKRFYLTTLLTSEK